MKKELPLSSQEEVKLHLSNCRKCRTRHPEISLKLALDRMMESHLPAELEGKHLDNELLKRFWKGEIRDRKELEAITEHCIVCRDCRQRRRSLRGK